MRKLKLQIQTSIDGFVAGPNGESDWIFISGGDEAGFQKMIDLADSCDTLLMGRKMTRGFFDFWENTADSKTDSPQKTLAQLIVNMRKIVFSRIETVTSGRNAEVENRDLAAVVQALKKEPGKDILVYGGADFVSSLISQNLIDEYFILTCPVAIGKGLTIFKEQKVLKLESSTAYKNGKVLNKYLPV
ncbi:MAG TPA: dihydrofolate reductase family protein [Mucilaginibacter sp.]|jgi:dihydrofolate reductase|nr:dihydrofolate reductase family protein [Mucilaginibacter sp.]